MADSEKEIELSLKIVTIVGARPHFVKAAMVSRAIENSGVFEEVIVHTGQHYDYNLSGAFFEELGLPVPSYNLEVGSVRPLLQMAKMLEKLDAVITAESPDVIMVYGDTNSTAAGAIAAAKCNIPLVHVEAGLREFDKRIPEEVNKLLTDAVTDLYFCPTATGVKNLAAVGITKGVYLVGDVGIDLIAANMSKIEGLKEQVLTRFEVAEDDYYLVTCHREANTDDVENLREIVAAILALDRPVILPLHPRTRKALDAANLMNDLTQKGIVLTTPLGFWDIQVLLKYAKATVTDSGGIIKEAYYHRTPAVVIDKQTEWIETVEEGWNQVAGPKAARIVEMVNQWQRPNIHSNCLGDGTASVQLIEQIKNYLQK